MVLAPFQKQIQVEFNSVKLKEIAVRFLTFVNPLDKFKQVNKFKVTYILFKLLYVND